MELLVTSARLTAEKISVYMYFAFRQACTNDRYYDKTAHAQTDPHVSIWRESAFGGNLRVL